MGKKDIPDYFTELKEKENQLLANFKANFSDRIGRKLGDDGEILTFKEVCFIRIACQEKLA